MQKFLTRSVVRIAIVAITVVQVQLRIVWVPVTVDQVTIGPQSFYTIASYSPNICFQIFCVSPCIEQCVAFYYAYYDTGSFF